jgi:DNA-binding NarL/FixJ family response regulator
VSATFDELVRDGKDALQRGDVASAREALDAALAEGESGEALEARGKIAYIDTAFADCMRWYERAHAAYRAEHDPSSAIRTARLLAFMNGGIIGDGAVMNGWMARAETLGGDEDSIDRGWVALTRSLFEPDRPTKDALLQESLGAARRFGDSDLELVSLAYLGASMVHGGRTAEGMTLLDEALAAVTAGEAEDFMIYEDVFCQLFAACEYARDVTRADQWIRIGTGIAARRSLPSVAAFCHTHYGGLLTVAGRWAEADAALTEAARIWDLGFGGLRSGALIRLADLRVRQGRFEEAEQLLDGFDLWPEAARPLAALQLARGNPMLAIDVLERALEQMDAEDASCGPLLGLLAEIHLERGDAAEAIAAVERLEGIANKHPSDYNRASASLARGKVCLGTRTGDGAALLRDALSGFGKAQVPVEVALTRIELARALRDDRPEVAISEAKAALEVFERLQASRLADAAAALLRELGAPVRTGQKRGGAGGLTKRESEVLELLRLGLSNPEISDRLFISRKTVEHHVGNVLAKLGLRSRAEAAAYATRAGEKTSG